MIFSQKDEKKGFFTPDIEDTDRQKQYFPLPNCLNQWIYWGHCRTIGDSKVAILLGSILTNQGTAISPKHIIHSMDEPQGVKAEYHPRALDTQKATPLMSPLGLYTDRYSTQESYSSQLFREEDPFKDPIKPSNHMTHLINKCTLMTDH